MQFLQDIDECIDNAYITILSNLDKNIKISKTDHYMLHFELSEKIDKNTLFTKITKKYETDGCYVTFMNDFIKNRYLIELSWGNYIRPEDEYERLMTLVRDPKFLENNTSSNVIAVYNFIINCIIKIIQLII